MDFNHSNQQNQNQNQNSPDGTYHFPYQNGQQNPYQNMNGQPNGQPNPNPYPNSELNSSNNALSMGCFVLGIIAIGSACIMIPYVAIVLGSIAVVLGLLSKGREEKVNSQAKSGIICATIGMVLNCFVILWSLYTVFSNGTTFRQFDQMYEEIYGESFSDMYEDLTGESFYY